MTDEQIDAMTRAIRAIAHGPTSGPTGLELVAMALGSRDGSVAESLNKVAGAIDRLADAVESHPNEDQT